jgi:predicted nucleotidyltransferase
MHVSSAVQPWNEEMVQRAAERFRREDERVRQDRRRRHATALDELVRLTDIAREFPGVKRLITWGSVLKIERFTELSDIDLCVEGIGSPEQWNLLERKLFFAATLPLDLVRWEELMEPHRRSIIERGRVLYESP